MHDIGARGIGLAGIAVGLHVASASATDWIVDHRAGHRLPSWPLGASLPAFARMENACSFSLCDASVAIGLRASIPLTANGTVFARTGGGLRPSTTALSGMDDAGAGAVGFTCIAISGALATPLSADGIVDGETGLIAVTGRGRWTPIVDDDRTRRQNQEGRKERKAVQSHDQIPLRSVPSKCLFRKRLNCNLLSSSPGYRSTPTRSASGQQVGSRPLRCCQSPIERRVRKPTRPSAPPTS